MNGWVRRWATAGTLFWMGGIAHAAEFAPFKDDLFDYPQPTASLDNGRLLDVPYNEERDIDRRDEVPERKVRGAYVDLSPSRSQEEGVFHSTSGVLNYLRVETSDVPSTILIFVHGRNGDRRLGMNDWSFGGNFNRLKNLLLRSGGAYLTVDGGRLDQADTARVGEFVADLKARHPSSRLLLACASMGGQVCWGLADSGAARWIDGMILLATDSDTARFEAWRKPDGRDVPLLLAHGTRDPVYRFHRQRSFFDEVRSRHPNYPIRFVGFEDGNHGTPMRMIDWRDALNWIAENGR